jgi:hypothetical protein
MDVCLLVVVGLGRYGQAKRNRIQSFDREISVRQLVQVVPEYAADPSR